MSLDWITALSIVRTLSGRPGYPRKPEGEADMANTLIDCCVSEAHARAVIAEFEESFPTPGQVRTQAANLRDKFDSVKKTKCLECDGYGWTTEIKMVKGVEHSFAKLCVCRRRGM